MSGSANNILSGSSDDLPPQRQKGAAFTTFLQACDAQITEESITLTVEVKDEDAAVIWKKDKSELNLDSDKFSVSRDGSKRSLHIKNGRLSDTGRFSCWKGSNSYTEAVVTFRNADGKSQADLDREAEEARKAAEDASRALTKAEENELSLERLFQEFKPKLLEQSNNVSLNEEAKDNKNFHFDVIVKNCTQFSSLLR